MLTFSETVNGIVVTKTLYTVNSSLFTGSSRKVTGSNWEQRDFDFVQIGIAHFKVGDYFFLDAAQATTYAPLITAVSNNTLAAAANTNTPNAAVQLTSTHR